MKISGYIPCLNGANVLAQTVESFRRQSRPVDELIVVDDGSTDATRAVAGQLGVRVVAHSANLGRGAARASAMRELSGDLVIGCDCGDQLAPDFVERALPWFDDPAIAGVCGRLTLAAPRTAIARWRGKYIYRSDQPEVIERHCLFRTGGSVLRAFAAKQAGGYQASLRHSEDRDLGERLFAAGFDVVCDPAVRVFMHDPDSLGQLLEAYWRWNAGPAEKVSCLGYARTVWYSLKVMVAADLRARDLACAGISLLAPHYQFWRSLLRKKNTAKPA